MRSNFSVTCPYCKSLNDFTGDDWRDELTDDSERHDIPCLKCGKEMLITVDAIYSLSAEKQEDEEEPRP